MIGGELVACVCALAMVIAVATALGAQGEVKVEADTPAMRYAARRLEPSVPAGARVRLTVMDKQTASRLAEAGCAAVPELGKEAFAIRRDRGGEVYVVGGDAAGVLYGALELAERLSRGPAEKVGDSEGSPRFGVRAIKFNLPWMSYRKHEALQLHSQTCRDLKFWEAFLDMMAENRFNTLTLWNLHPFHLMIRPKEFPEACEFSDAELAEWQGFWRKLMAMAHERGIQVHMFYWNIFVSPAFAKAHDVAKYSVDWSFFGEGDRSELVKKYNRACVTQLIDEYPDLDGIGIAMSERMGGMTPEERGEWVKEVIVAGIKAAKRPVHFNLRIPHSANTGSGGSTSRDSESLGRRLLESVDLPGPLWTEIKFNWSHGHSSPALHIIHGGKPTDVLWNPPPEKYKVLWQVRNEDFFVLRWGDAGFVREHIARNGIAGAGGYFVGSECYIPTKDYITRPAAEVNWKYAFERQWLFYKVWGRLLYEPKTPDEVFEAGFDKRYGAGTGKALLPAMARASRVPERIATYVGFTWDHTLYTEGLLAGGELITLGRLGKVRPVDPAYLSVGEYAALGGKPVPKGRISPLALADEIEADAQAALAAVKDLPAKGAVKYEIADVQAWSQLGLHFAHKLRAAVAMALKDKETARREMGEAIKAWDRLVEITDPLYLPTPLEHAKEPFSWKALSPQVHAEAVE